MSISKDKRTNTWTVQYRYADVAGMVKHGKKRGFKTKREAGEWEANKKYSNNSSCSMLFADFIEIYLGDMRHRVKETTLAGKQHIIYSKIVPMFGKMKLNEILPRHIRAWQNELKRYTDKNNHHYAQTYLRTINNQLVAIFNYAKKYYNLPSNPCHIGGTMGVKNAKEMQFWTKVEFDHFIAGAEDIADRAIFLTLYYTGIRSGELLALTAHDIDFNAGCIAINKSYAFLNGKEIISSPKTAKSNRIVYMPQILVDALHAYISSIYDLQGNERLFPYRKDSLRKKLLDICEKTDVKIIRVHDLRHSHASLLVELGFSAKLIADRLGHEKIQTTLDTYSHLYPNKQLEVVQRLNEM